jgi:type I restriction enzyme R subunit
MPSPEELAREKIDKLLTDCGWIIQSRSTINLDAAHGIAIREGLLKGGEADYLLFADKKAIGTIEAKPEGFTLIGVDAAAASSGSVLHQLHYRMNLPACQR